MVDVVEAEHTGISVVADEADVFVLLLHYFVVLKLSLLVIIESPVKERAVIYIRKTAQKYIHIATVLLSAHAVSGYDTVGGYFGIGKGTVIKMLNTGKSIRPKGDMTACLKEVVKEATKLASACYGMPYAEEMSITRHTLWAVRVGKSGKTMQSPASLPPTTEAFYGNMKRANIQACIWKHAFDAHPPDLDPCDYGWQKDEVSDTHYNSIKFCFSSTQ
ncbi:hypothetical protein DPMN_145279 [Dreissena polymorpha]|uniref:Uncharacterized protein n=1 Tax=Dreissena polymorpha TaxID=45954 RepID=A0A9D4F5Q2_DREPO|nr:hypothetical protein DPMN_145279 [Dreissena polymorpha]